MEESQASAWPAPMARRLAPGLEVWGEATRVGVLRRNGRALLINGASPEVLLRHGLRPADVDWVLVTHADRSAAEGVRELAAAGARVAVPDAERSLFEKPEEFWASDKFRVHAYHYHPSPRTLREAVPVARGLKGGDTLEWQGLTIRALDSPGPTDGGLSYLVEVGGVRSAFVGDLISGPGQLWEFHSLQGSRPLPGGGRLMEYHGFGERSADVLRSLKGVLALNPTVLIPLHGTVIDRPTEAVRALEANLQACLASYYRTSAGQWYFAGARPEWPADRSALLKRCRPLPPWVREVGGTSRAVVADDGHALVIDSADDIPERIASLREAGKLGPVDALWVTHYHDDHVGSVNALREQEGCRVTAHESMVDILRRPQAYLMPCLDPIPITVDRVTRDGERWEWRGFSLTAFTFPGQSIYDAALLVEREGDRVLFVGDSLTPGGLDDYCALNRNLLGPGLGYDRCLALLEKLGPGILLVNEHCDGAFAFTRSEVAGLRSELRRRRNLFRKLLPWDDPNYGLDPQWVRCDPYHQETRPGETVEWTVHVRSYSSKPRNVEVGLRAPEGWRVLDGSGRARVPAGGEGSVRLRAAAPEDAKGRRAVVGFTLTHGGRPLLEVAEAIVDLRP